MIGKQFLGGSVTARQDHFVGQDRLIKNTTNKGVCFIWLDFLGVEVFLQDLK